MAIEKARLLQALDAVETSADVERIREAAAKHSSLMICSSSTAAFYALTRQIGTDDPTLGVVGISETEFNRIFDALEIGRVVGSNFGFTPIINVYTDDFSPQQTNLIQ